MTITPAEAKTIRERIGVNTAFIADRIGVTKGRVWDYESPTRRRHLPEHASGTLLTLSATFDRAVEAKVKEARKSGTIPRHTSIEEFETWCPELAGWGTAAQAALIAAVQQQTQATVVYR